MDQQDLDSELDLREYFRVLRRRKWWVALVVVLVVAAAVGFSLLQTPVYSATAKVLVPLTDNQAPQVGTMQNAPSQNSQLLDRLLQNEVQFADSDDVKKAASEQGTGGAKVGVGSSTDSDVLTFSANSADAKRAAEIANTYANAYLTQRRKAKSDDYFNAIDVLAKKIVQLQQQGAGLDPGDPQAAAITQTIDTYTQQIQSLTVTSQLVAAGGEVTQAAKVPTDPSSPDTKRNALLAAAVGIVLGIGLAFLVDRFDDAVRSKRDLELAAAGLPVIGLIPRLSGWRNHADTHIASLESPQSPVTEAYRTLRTSVQFLGIDQPLRVIGITSADAAEGKTTTLVNLAVSLAQAGQRVIIIGGDLRKPRLHAFFGKDNAVGFTNALLGDVSLDDALQSVDEQPRLRILTSGPQPPNPSELLALDRVRALVEWLAGQADVVLIDCPPVLPVADALIISHLVSGMIIVAQAGKTSKRDVARATELLAQVDAPVIGTILNDVSSRGGYDYGYGYAGYGSYGSYRSEPSAKNGNGAGNAARTQRRQWRQRARDVVNEEQPPAAVEASPGDQA